jgi:hypothetical protein
MTSQERGQRGLIPIGDKMKLGDLIIPAVIIFGLVWMAGNMKK